MDWIHCNTCFTCPSTNRPTVFCLSSCGHLFCINCLKKADTGFTTVSGNDLCKICQKKCTYLEVNRSLKSDLQMFFKHPRELLNQYMKNMKSVIEFQTFHRSHLQKHFSDKASKASKYVKQAQMELIKKAEREKFLVIECEKLKSDLEKQVDLLHSFENLIAEKDKEIIQLRQKSTQLKHNKPRPNLSSNTPLSTLSFINCATSTPICDMQLFEELNTSFNNGKLKTSFTPNSGNFDIVITKDCRFLGDASAGTILNTPTMLGISSMHGNEKYLNNQPTNLF